MREGSNLLKTAQRPLPEGPKATVGRLGGRGSLLAGSISLLIRSFVRIFPSDSWARGALGFEGKFSD